MMKSVLVPVSLLFLSAANAQQTDSLKAIKILQQLEAKNASLQQLTTHVRYEMEDTVNYDAIRVVEGTLWLTPKPNDTIFGNVFHLKGTDNKGAFDCYYDGHTSFEIRHVKKTVLAIDPYLFSNGQYNPAKNKGLMSIYEPLLFDKHLVRSLVTNSPFAAPSALKLQETADEWMVTLKYPPTKGGALISRVLHIRKQSMQLTQTTKTIQYMGTTRKDTHYFDKTDTGNKIAPDSIELRETFSDYTFEEKEPDQPKPLRISPLVGKQASVFNLPAFGGGTVSLESLKGKYVLLNFWESWSGYSIMTIPYLKTHYLLYKSRGLEIVGISTENEKQIAQLIQAQQLPYKHLKGNKELLSQYDITEHPSYVLIDKTGKIVAHNNIAEIEKILKSTW
ncbi:TlpA family protein disulfide reductase [Chitinophaga arvensicola]|uniref:Peroxiredoxin n=1 Tax=Chitinophaga arvensicola TaxID=29529 RepID=A0A1I0SA14_9BACT|nr:TlpA disulfide reductase family protein [Chitinophaga arvensicola]SEW53104.1 Peroxiredoxin [Chitinophaga arvensicola]